jgi:hypothetical protein
VRRARAASVRLVAAVACLQLGAVAARAQLPYLDPLPWFAPADSTVRQALVVDFDRGGDDVTGWTLDRTALTVTLPAGDHGAWFLRASYLRFDAGSRPLLERWPGVRGADAAANWPGETVANGFGPLEVGVVGPARLPLLGPWRLAGGIGLPTGSNRLYPFSSTSIPVRLAMRRGTDLGRVRLWVHGGALFHLDATGDELSDTAFPSGFSAGTEAAWYRGRGSRLTVGFDLEDRDGRRSQLVTAAVWVPWREAASLGFRLRWEVAGEAHRPEAWYATFSVRFEGPRAVPEEPAAAD